ncbi:MAG: insulinase family protein, partial [Roseivirga sp.]|nr:insulinase family protein [Roseivirga sp.]
IEEGEEAIWNLIEAFKSEELSELEVTKVKNKAESTLVFSEMELLNRAMNLAYAEMLGDVSLVNQELAKIRGVGPEDILAAAKKVLRKENASVLRYKSNKK